MSTRCQIGIYRNDRDIKDDKSIMKKSVVLLYRHSDGYPGIIGKGKNGKMGVIPDILLFINEFIKVRGYDIEYMGACLIAYLKYWHCGRKAIDRKVTYYRPGEYMELNGFEISPLGHGISDNFHWDIAYYYAITPSAITVYKVNVGEKQGKNGIEELEFKFDKIESHSIKK